MIKIIIQARLGSTRLPGKILKEVIGKPLLQHMIERLKFSEYSKDVIIATTKKSSDDPIVSLLEKIEIPYYRGDENDVLDRYYQAAKKYKIKV